LPDAEEDAGIELGEGADEELSDPALDFAPLSPEEVEEESLPPSLELEAPSFEELSLVPPSDFGAADDFEG